MTELELPEPDTHCLDDEGGRPIDVWSYSPELVREIIAADRAQRVPPMQAMPIEGSPSTYLAYTEGWNHCVRAMLSAAPAQEAPQAQPERKPMKAADIVALHKSIEPEATAISELMLRTIRAVESFHGIKEKP